MTTPLRIAVVAPPWLDVPPPAYGGIESVCAGLVDGLVERGHDVTLYGAGTSGTRARFVASFPEPQLPRIGAALPEVLHAAVVARDLAERPVDIVHDHTLAGPLLARGRRTPTVLTVHGPLGGEVGVVVRALGSTVNLVAISANQRGRAPELPWAGTVHNAIRTSEYPFESVKEPYVLFLGRCSPEKGLTTAITAAREAGLRLVIAAKCQEPEEHAYFANEVKPLLDQDVTWLGEVGGAGKLELLRRASALLFPIDWDEPFGMVMIEAMACGTPVVALGRGSVPEVVVHGVTGLIATSEDELPGLLRQVGDIDPHACRERVRRCFDLERMVSGYEQVYRRVLDSSALRGRPGPAVAVAVAGPRASGVRQEASTRVWPQGAAPRAPGLVAEATTPI